MKLRKYCTSKSEPGISELLKHQRPNEASEILFGEESWYLALYNAEPGWDEFTKAVGAITFVPKNTDSIDCICFDLFYGIDDMLAFWAAHKDGLQAFQIDPNQYPNLSDAPKDKRLDGSDGVDEEHPSAWAEVYAASLFYDRGWATLDELHYACFSAHFLQMFLEACDEYDMVWMMPAEGDIEINCRFGDPSG